LFASVCNLIVSSLQFALLVLLSFHHQVSLRWDFFLLFFVRNPSNKFFLCQTPLFLSTSHPFFPFFVVGELPLPLFTSIVFRCLPSLLLVRWTGDKRVTIPFFDLLFLLPRSCIRVRCLYFALTLLRGEVFHKMSLLACS